MKFRKIPVTVDAIKFTDELNLRSVPEWFMIARLNGTVYEDGNQLKMKTLEGLMTAEKGDWIIQGVEGEIYSCKPEIFNKTYESVDILPKESKPLSTLNKDIKNAKDLQKQLVEEILKQSGLQPLTNKTLADMGPARQKRIW